MELISPPELIRSNKNKFYGGSWFQRWYSCWIWVCVCGRDHFLLWIEAMNSLLSCPNSKIVSVPGCVFGAMVYSYSVLEFKIVTFFLVKRLEQKNCRWTTLKVSKYVLWRIMNSDRPLSAEFEFEFLFLEENTFYSGLKPQTPCWLFILELFQILCNIWSSGLLTFNLKFCKLLPCEMAWVENL